MQAESSYAQPPSYKIGSLVPLESVDEALGAVAVWPRIECPLPPAWLEFLIMQPQAFLLSSLVIARALRPLLIVTSCAHLKSYPAS